MDMMVGKMIAYLKEMSIKLKMVQCGEDLLDRYISPLPVLWFCSSNYDTVFISKKLAMKMDLEQSGYVIKKINTYLYMANEKLRFLDLANYFSCGASYAQFLASFSLGESKGVWPHDYLTNMEQLDEPLPPIGPTWFSQLKMLNQWLWELKTWWNIIK